jgi:hypothetical protein
LGASLSRAVCSPTLLYAACAALGLIAGPFRPFLRRNFSSEASPPGSAPSADGSLAGRVLARLQRGISHQHLATGTAPAFGRALAPCNGSDLLTLRLLSICSWVTRFCAPPQLGGFASFARLARSPPRRVTFAPRLAGRAFWWGGPTGHCAASWSYSSNHNPLGNCINAGPETDPGSNSAWTRFLSSRFAAQFQFRIAGPAATPARGTGDICLGRLAPPRGQRHQLPPTFPRLPGIIPVVPSAGFSCRRASTVVQSTKHH